MPRRALALVGLVTGVAGLALLGGLILPCPGAAIRVSGLDSGRALAQADLEPRSPLTTPAPATTLYATTAPARGSTDIDRINATAAHTASTKDVSTSTTEADEALGTIRTTPTPVVTHAADIGILAPRDVVVPIHLVVPALSVDGPIVPAGVNANDELDVPPDARTLAWYRYGPAPGEPGSAVIAGHLNWRKVRGHFADLAEIPLGASVTVLFSDGTQRGFTVSKVELALKPEIAAKGVFDPDGDPVLRLITCGGEFEREVHSYRSNVIVTAVPE